MLVKNNFCLGSALLEVATSFSFMTKGLRGSVAKARFSSGLRRSRKEGETEGEDEDYIDKCGRDR